MKKLFIALVAVLLVGVIYLANYEVKSAPTAPTQATELKADTIFNLVNAERTKAGLAPLVRDTRLDESAQIKADDMTANNYFAHINPETGVNGYTLIPNGICSYKSENIIKVDKVGEKNTDAIEWWMNSKPHREAILSQEYDIAGMAVSGNVGTMHFCNLK
jgi:uncharacterized protein YkwD